MDCWSNQLTPKSNKILIQNNNQLSIQNQKNSKKVTFVAMINHLNQNTMKKQTKKKENYKNNAERVFNSKNKTFDKLVNSCDLSCNPKKKNQINSSIQIKRKYLQKYNNQLNNLNQQKCDLGQQQQNLNQENQQQQNLGRQISSFKDGPNEFRNIKIQTQNLDEIISLRFGSLVSEKDQLFQSAQHSLTELDPCLLSISSQLDEQHKKQKQAFMSQKFIQRYLELVQTQKQYHQYKIEKENQICQLKNLLKSTRDQLEETKDGKQYLLSQIDRINQLSEQAKFKIEKQFNKKEQQFSLQISKSKNQERYFNQVIKKKDFEIQKLQAQIIQPLQNRLDQMVLQNSTLQESIRNLTKSFYEKVQQIGSIQQKYSQLISTLQQTLHECQKQGNNSSQQLQKIAQELYVMKLKQKESEKEKKKLELDLQLKNKQLQKLNEKMNLLKEDKQNQILGQKMKYLQQFKEKNFIVDQFQQTKQSNANLMLQTEQLKSKLSKLSFQNLNSQMQLRTQRSSYLQQCSTYESKLSFLNQNLKNSNDKLLQQSKEQSEKQQLVQKQMHQLIQKSAKLQNQLSFSKNILQSQTKQLNDLKRFKQIKEAEFQQTKKSFSDVVKQLKVQLQKAKQIIRSKNQQINEVRKMNNNLRDQCRELKCQRCELQNQVRDCQEKRQKQVDILNQELIQAKTQCNNMIKQKLKINIQTQTNLNKLSKSLNQIKSENTLKQEQIQLLKSQLKAKQTQIISKNCQILSLIKESQLKQIVFQNSQREYYKKINILQTQSTQEKYEFRQQVQTLKQMIKKKQTEQQINSLLIKNQQQQIISLSKSLVLAREEVSFSEKSKLSQLNQQLASANIKLKSLAGQNKQLSQLFQCQLLENKKKQNQIEALLLNQTVIQINSLSISEKNLLSQQNNISQQNRLTEQNLPSQEMRVQECLSRKYVEIIEKMKMDFMDLTLQFKERSAQEQQLRMLLEQENQQLKELLKFKKQKN